jgi:hypothetical protein
VLKIPQRSFRSGMTDSPFPEQLDI